MSDAKSAARLRRVSECIRDGRPIDPIDAPPLAHGIDTYLAGTAPSLEAALGLTAPGRGQLSARRALMLRERDEALVELHLELGGALDKGEELRRRVGMLGSAELPIPTRAACVRT